MRRRKYPKIEDILDELSRDLESRGFERKDAKESEIVCYGKRESSIDFQVEIEEAVNEPEEPEFNHVYMRIGCNIPTDKDFLGSEVYKLFPNLIHYLYRNTKIYHQGLCGNEDTVKEGRVNLYYHIGFEKRKTNAGEMKAVLREVIDYVCSYMTTNIEMLERTRSLRE